jgi:hypothetical protein
MKTITQLLLVASACITTTAFSQTRLGFTAGTSIASVKNKSDHPSTSDSKIGLTAGIIVNSSISPHFSIQPALNFVQKGGKEKNADDKVTFNYVELPVNLIYNTDKYYGFFVGAGPAISAGISGKDTYSYNGVIYNDKMKFGKNKDFQRMEFSINALAGYRFPIGLQVAVNYNQGLSNLFFDKAVDGTLKNRYFGVRLGYLVSSYKKP